MRQDLLDDLRRGHLPSSSAAASTSSDVFWHANELWIVV